MAAHFLLLWMVSFLVFLGSRSTRAQIQGDSFCGSTMCVRAFRNGTQWTYQMQANLGESRFGWMAIGFGTSMQDSQMVIMWPNRDGFVTLSQRTATGHLQPRVDANPRRIATKYLPLSYQTSSLTALAFTIPSNDEVVQHLIWSIATSRPPTAAVDTTLTQHVSFGNTVLYLNRTFSDSTLAPVPTGPPGSAATYLPPFPTQTSGQSLPEFQFPPLLPYQKMLMAHAILSGIGFLIVLPIGALIGRWARTFTTTWFKGHWFFQAVLGIPIIWSGWFLAVAGIISKEGRHFDDTHKVLGLVLIGAYTLQLLLGVHIHLFKPRRRPIPAALNQNVAQLITTSNRPFLNYLHAFVGLSIITLSFYQVYLGINVEWEVSTGRGSAPRVTEKVWIAWAVILPVVYLLGLSLLPKQLKQEQKLAQVKARGSDALPLKPSPPGSKKSVRGLQISNPIPVKEGEEVWRQDEEEEAEAPNNHDIMSEDSHGHSMQPVQFARAF
ncbi:hypothetical protein FRC14_000477 [Serendipita sp. 396]|nr:hypothetical protein FRC14_000477 [Serendipita sp. 396]KAG8825254.1 hypothetical protein FRC19_011818 [Serendipita sp. 401]